MTYFAGGPNHPMKDVNRYWRTDKRLHRIIFQILCKLVNFNQIVSALKFHRWKKVKNTELYKELREGQIFESISVYTGNIPCIGRLQSV